MPFIDLTIGEIARLIPFTIKFCGGRYVIHHQTFELIHGCKASCFVQRLRTAGKA